jgi:LPS export ABC transporter permease LptG/LPS export ABC transporter permease LptF
VLKLQKIQWVIYREILPPAGISFFVLTFVVFSREFGRFTELLIRKNADVLTVLKFVVFLLPGVLVFTVPIAFLVGTLIGFSRMSSESEVVAMRAGGISLNQIMIPVVRMGIMISAITLVLTMFLLPAGNWRLKLAREEIGVRPVVSAVKPRVFNEDLPGFLLYIHDQKAGGIDWEGVILAHLDKGKGQHRIILSKSGQIEVLSEREKLQLHLVDGANYEFSQKDPSKYRASEFGSLSVSVDLPVSQSVATESRKVTEKDLSELLLDYEQGASDARRIGIVELHRRVAMGITPLIFAILGVTLGIRTHRGGRSYGSVVSLVVAFAFYLLFATGARLAMQEAIPISMGIWGPNLLLAGAALLSVRYASRASGDGTLHWQSSVIANVIGFVRQIQSRLSAVLWRITRRLWQRIRKLSLFQIGLTRVVDLYLMRTFLIYFSPTLLMCLSIFYLFTFFELIDDLVANEKSYGLMFSYFVYLLPHALMLLIPISMLIATLITFGVMEKTSQLVALKANGISLYRVVLPVLLVASVVSIGTFILQEYVLPYANQRQDNLRNVIKGRPVQTFYQAGRNWIFGEGNRLYNYNYFDPDRSLFADLSIYEIGLSRNRLNRHIYATRVTWNHENQNWSFEEGWIRDLTQQNPSFSEFDLAYLDFPEKPDYFVQEVKESSKMTFMELRDYLEELRVAGFEVGHLRTDLHTKLAFPFVSMIMVVLGVPFALSIGRKGTLYGVALGVFLGIFYWGAFGVFEVLGNNGLLAPILAAWGPNLVVGSSSLFLLFSAKT